MERGCYSRAGQPPSLTAMALVASPSLRPLLKIEGNDLAESLPPGHEFASTLDQARPAIRRAIAATGRIELGDRSEYKWAGCGFLSGQALVVTAGHTADLIAPSGDRGILRHSPVFRLGVHIGEGPAYQIVSCRLRHPVLDLAVLELASIPDIQALSIDAAMGVAGETVAVIAGNAADARNSSPWLDLLGNVEEGRKMFAPGRILGHSADRYHAKGTWSLNHDCATLGGSAGAPLLHLGSGHIVGCHFGGLLGQENYAVPASELALDPRIRALGLDFTGGLPDPDPLAFGTDYTDGWGSAPESNVWGARERMLEETELKRVHQQLAARYPDLDDALENLRQRGPEYADAIDSQPGRGRVSDSAYLGAILDSMNRRGLLGPDLVSDLLASEDSAGWSESAAPPAPLPGGVLSEATLDAVTAVLPDAAFPYVLGSPLASQLVGPDGTMDPLPTIVRRLARSSSEEARETLGWLLHAVANREDAPAMLTPIAAALDELDMPHPTKVARPPEPDPGQIVDISFLSAGLAAARSVGRVRYGGTSSTDQKAFSRAAGSTGWLIAPDIVVAPAHIVTDGTRLLSRDEVNVSEFRIEFDDGAGQATAATAATEVALLNFSTDLMLLRLTEPVTDRAPLQLDLTRPSKGPVAAIHYPNLGPKALSYLGGQILSNDGHEVWYMLATTRGSAGAPVFNQTWKVVATHRAASRSVDESGKPLAVKLGTSVEALVGVLRDLPSTSWLWRRICGAQESLRSIDPVLLSPQDDVARPALLTVVDESIQVGPMPGLTIISRDRESLTVLVSSSAARKLAATPDIVSLTASGTAHQPECRRSLPFIGVPLDRAGIDETGDHALVALIDDGIDPFHLAFRDAQGASRVDIYWDQRDTTVAPSEPALTRSAEAAALVTRLGIHGGAVYVSADFDALADNEKAALRRGVDHGTAVASIAAGRATGSHPLHFSGGLAPDARLIVVRFDTGGQTIGASVGHQHALRVIALRAGELGLPVVVNISNGTNSGAHDGTSIVERECARFLEEPNRAIVKSAGNELGAGRHAQFDIVDTSTRALKWVSKPSTLPAREGASDELELWFGSHNVYDFVLEDANRKRTGVFPVMRALTEQLSTLNEIRAKYEHIAATTNPSKSRLSITITPGKKKAVQAGDDWKLIITPRDFRGRDTFHAWFEEQPDRQLSFKADVETKYTITIPGTGREVITVGAIEAEPGRMAFENGSSGPNTDGYKKPDLVAPGVQVAAARAGTERDVMPEARSGTSFAAPHVAGAIALAFSMAHKLGAAGAPVLALTHGEIRQLLLNSLDAFNVDGDPVRGFGSLNVRALLDAVRDRISSL